MTSQDIARFDTAIEMLIELDFKNDADALSEIKALAIRDMRKGAPSFYLRRLVKEQDTAVRDHIPTVVYYWILFHGRASTGERT